ncbi:MAG: AAA family ATPase [Pyrinomonadaceae bacterium]
MTFEIPVPAQAVLAHEPDPISIGRTARELLDATPEEPDWLVPGLLAPGTVTELNAREKAGKGWFINYLIGALERGQQTVFGESRGAKSLIFTEESYQPLREKFEKFRVYDAYVVFHWEMGQRQWPETVRWLTEFMVTNEHELLFIDNISAATRTQDEGGVELARKVEPLVMAAKEHEFAVLFDRHQRKAGGKIEDLSRGTTSLAGAIDAIVTMEKDEGRVRKLTCRGRLFAHNWVKHVELMSDHTGYAEIVGDSKTQKLFERSEWSVVEFATEIGRGLDTARDWLNECPYVEKRGAGKSTKYVVVAEPADLS